MSSNCEQNQATKVGSVNIQDVATWNQHRFWSWGKSLFDESFYQAKIISATLTNKSPKAYKVYSISYLIYLMSCRNVRFIWFTKVVTKIVGTQDTAFGDVLNSISCNDVDII